MPDISLPTAPQQPDVSQVTPEVTSTPPISEPVTPNPTPTPVNPPAPKPKQSHLKLFLLVAVLVIVVGLASWYLLAHRTNKNQSSGSQKLDIPLITYASTNNPFNAFYPSQNAVNGSLEMNEQIFEGLVQFTNGVQVEPDLAVSWTNPTSTTWIFKLRPNVYFHDGDTVTAQDVVYSWQQVNAQSAQLAAYVTSTIENVVAINNLTVEITTIQPDEVLLNRLADLWILDSKAPKNTQPWELGTGAYTVKSGTTPTANNIDLVAFNKWHGGHIYTRAINYVFYPDSDTATSALIDGKANLADGLTATNQNSIAKSNNKNLTYFNNPSLYVDFLAFNTKNTSYPTANPKIREAIALTLNPSSLLSAYGIAGNVVDQVIPQQIPGYIPNYTRPAINITEAKQLVSEAGYPNGVTIDLGIGEPAIAVGQAMAKELAPIGITLKLEEATDEGTYFNNIDTGVYQAFYQGVETAISDASDVLGSTWQDTGYYNNPTFDSELTAAEQNFNPTQRLTELQQASQTLLNDNAYVPLYELDGSFGSVKNVIYPLNVYDQDLNSYFANVYQK